MSPARLTILAGRAGFVAAVVTLLVPRVPLWVILAVSIPVVVASTTGALALRRSDRDRHEALTVLERQKSTLQAALDTTQRHLLHETALVQCSRVLLETDGEIDLDQALRGLTEATDSDYLLVERNVDLPGVGMCSRPVKWIARDPSARDPSGYWRDAPWSQMPKSYQALARGKVHTFSWLTELPDVERELYAASDPPIRAEIDIPIMVSGRWEGIVGFAHSTEGKQWDSWDIELIRTVADLFGAHWEREGAQERLRWHASEQERLVRHEHALRECSATLLGDPDDRGLEAALQALAGPSRADHAYFEENFDDPRLGLCSRTVLHVAREGSAATWPSTYPWSNLPRTYQTLAAHQPISYPKGEEAPARRPGCRLEAEIAVPLVVDGEWIGLVGIASDHPQIWTPWDLGLMRSATEIFATWWVRRRARQELEELVRAKDRFIASVSHELRTPLTAVIGLASELADRQRSFSEPEVAEFVGLIADQSREVGHIVEDLLVAARASEAQLTVLPERVGLDEEVRRVVSELPRLVHERLSLGELPSVAVQADPLRVRQIVRNLLTNAHRYGGDPIEVRVGLRNGRAYLQVIDHGPGIPAEMREQVFLAYRSAAEIPGRTASIGLGLTVSRQLARLMGGDVTYRYEGESVFELTLPTPASTRASA
jgi:signal transduction histidine kinase